MTKYCAYEHGLYVLLAITNCASQSDRWARIGGIPSSSSVKDVRADIQAYCTEHNLIQCFVTPKLARRERRKWEKRNGRKVPELSLITSYSCPNCGSIRVSRDRNSEGLVANEPPCTEHWECGVCGHLFNEPIIEIGRDNSVAGIF